MCIFDIDNTLTHGELASSCETQMIDIPPPGWPPNGGTTQAVKNIISKCREKGYGIALATSENETEYNRATQHKFLNSLGFDDNFLGSPNFQQSCKVITSMDDDNRWCLNNEFKDKTSMYINIMNYNNISPENWKYSIVFDDSIDNLAIAARLGFKICQASLQCGGIYCSQGCGMPSSCADVIV